MHTLGMKFLHHSSLLILLLFSYSPKKTQSSKIKFHTLHIRSADSTECHRLPTTAGSGPNRMEVVERYGACAPGQNQNQRRPTLAQILHLDQLRAESIQARLKLTHQFMESKDQQADLPVQFQSDDVALDSAHHIVQLNLDQLNQSLSLALDTGRGPTFTQTCGSSTNSTPIACDDTLCSVFFRDVLSPGGETCSVSPMCQYLIINEIRQAFNTGTLSKVNLTGFPDFVFGCGNNPPEAPPYFGYGVDGVLGLGRGDLSFASQTNSTRFSYCLPSNSSSTGYLKLGENNNTHDNNDALLSFTPFVPLDFSSSYYAIETVAITVGGTKLQIANRLDINGTVIDTGLLITQLPPAAYGPMRNKFKRWMGTNNYTVAEAFSIFDTCYDTTKQGSITVPPVSFTFKNNVTVHLGVSGILYAVNSTLSCFAFALANDTDFIIFGSAQQRTLEMVFDVANDKLGFRQHGCA